MRVHYVGSSLLYQSRQRTDHTWVGDRWMKWLLGVCVEAAQGSVPTGKTMDGYVTVEFGTRPIRSSERDHVDVMPPTGEFVGEHLHVKIAPARQGFWVAVVGLHDAHQTRTTGGGNPVLWARGGLATVMDVRPLI